LLRSIPRIDGAPGERLESITGSVPHPFRRPTGCTFGPRCPSFMPGRCDAAEPALLRVGQRHTAACFLYSASDATPEVAGVNAGD
jgi:peptide/nickel transport system ATP-binding protein